MFYLDHKFATKVHQNDEVGSRWDAQEYDISTACVITAFTDIRKDVTLFFEVASYSSYMYAVVSNSCTIYNSKLSLETFKFPI
jgi:hypothetical protein